MSDLSHLDVVEIDIKELKPLNEHRELEYGDDWVYGPNQHCQCWGGWSTFFETWDMLSRDIDTPDSQLPVTSRIEKCWIERGWTHKELIPVYKSVYPAECRALFRSFKENEGFHRVLSNISPIDIFIEGDGSLTVRNGNKRISLLLWYGRMRKMDVKVYKRAVEWLRFKEEMYRLGEQKKRVYHEIPHPDFADWEVLHPSTDRFNAIVRDVCKLGDVKSILDFGCHTGFFSYNLAQIGYDVTAVDRSADYIAAAKSIGRVYRSCNPTFRVETIETICAEEKYDAILFLSLFHDALIERGEKAFEIFGKLSRIAPIMYFDMRDEGDIDSVIMKIFHESEYTTAQKVGKSSIGRTIVRFQNTGKIPMEIVVGDKK